MGLNVNDDVKLGVIGCGKMASAVLGGICKNRFLNPDNIFIYDINETAMLELSKKYGFRIANSIDVILGYCNTLFLAVKPFVAVDVLNEIRKNYSNQLILTILAGVKIEKYLAIVNNAKVIRIMPNTPALVNQGMSAVCASKKVDDSEIKFAMDFMANCGCVIQTTEDKIDIITALSGSGPAFYFKIIDAMAKSAQKLGLDYNQAMLLSAQTALGSAKMLMENDFNTAQLIKNVTTPGGCTEVGNNVLNQSDIEKILDETIEKTMKKAIELG